MVRHFFVNEPAHLIGICSDELQPDDEAIVQVGRTHVTHPCLQRCHTAIRFDSDRQHRIALQGRRGLDERTATAGVSQSDLPFSCERAWQPAHDFKTSSNASIGHGVGSGNEKPQPLNNIIARFSCEATQSDETLSAKW